VGISQAWCLYFRCLVIRMYAKPALNIASCHEHSLPVHSEWLVV
jgi:hypothetical protein